MAVFKNCQTSFSNCNCFEINWFSRMLFNEKKKKTTDKVSDINWVNNLTKRALSWPGHTPDRFIKPSVYIFEKLLLAFHLLPPFLWFYMCLILKQENHRDLFLFIHCRKSYHTKITYFIKMLNFSNQQQQLLWLSLLNVFLLQPLTLLEAKNATYGLASKTHIDERSQSVID